MGHTEGVPELVHDRAHVEHRLAPTHVQCSFAVVPRVAYGGRATIDVANGHLDARLRPALVEADARLSFPLLFGLFENLLPFLVDNAVEIISNEGRSALNCLPNCRPGSAKSTLAVFAR